MLSCILLSAGLSARFGSPKALAKINETTVIEHLQNTLVDTNIAEIVVVLGDRYEEIKSHILNHKKVKFVYNKDYNRGQTSSFKVGLRAVSPKSRGTLLMPIDTPAVKSTTIDALVDQFLEENPRILIPTYQDKRGHPPVFNRDLRKYLLDLGEAVGLNTFEHEHESDIRLFPVEDPGILESFNTPEEFERLKVYLVRCGLYP